MDVIFVLRRAELFKEFAPAELEAVAAICQERRCQQGEVIVTQGEPGQEMYIVCDGLVEVSVADAGRGAAPKKVVNLGRGQVFGEMALVDHGPRSGTVRAVAENTVVQVIPKADLTRLCAENNHLGYLFMRNLAADLSFKLRHRHLAEGLG